MLLLAPCQACTEAGFETGAELKDEVATFSSRTSALGLSPDAIGTEAPLGVQFRTGNYIGTAHGDSIDMVAFYDGGFIRGSRFTPEGMQLDPAGWIRLGRNIEGSEAYTDLAYGAGTFLLVYNDHGDDAPGTYGQTVAEDGTILSAPELIRADSIYVAAAFNGEDFTVASVDGDLHLSRFGVDGRPIPDSSLAVTSSGVTNRPAIAIQEDGLGLLVFEQAVDGERKVYAARFTQDGTVLDPGGVLISETTTSSVSVAVAAGTDGFMAVWSATDGSAVYASALDNQGQVTAREVLVSRTTGTVGGSAVAFNGETYLVAWEDDRSGEDAVFATELTQEANHLSDADTALSGPSRAGQSWDLELQWTGELYSLVYAQDGLFGEYFDRNLTAINAERLGLTAFPSAQGVPSLAWSGAQFVLAYSDEGNGSIDDLSVRSVDISVDGAVGPGVAISGDGERTGSVQVASNGQVTAFAYTPFGGDNSFVRIRPQSEALGPPIAWKMRGSSATMMSNGSTFVSLYSDATQAGANDDQVWGQTFDESGQPSGAPYKLVDITRPRGSAAPMGQQYLYAYSGQELDGAAITGNTLRFSDDGVVLAEYGPVMDGMLTASIGAHENTALIAWQDANDALWARMLDQDNGFSEPFLLTDLAAEGTPAIAWQEDHFLVVFGAERKALWSLEVDRSGTATSPEPLLSGDYGWPVLATAPDGVTLLSYVKWLDGSRSRRIESRFIGDSYPMAMPVDDNTPPDDKAPPSADPTPNDPGPESPQAGAEGGGPSEPPDDRPVDQAPDPAADEDMPTRDPGASANADESDPRSQSSAGGGGCSLGPVNTPPEGAFISGMLGLAALLSARTRSARRKRRR